MKKLAVLVATVMLLTAATASAKDMRGRFGVGYDQTLGGVSGLSLSYWVTNALGLDAVFGMSAVVPKASGADTKIGFNMALRAIYNIARAKHVNLGIGIEADMAFLNDAIVGPDGTFQFNLALPIIVEYFFSEHFAINLAMGITFEIISDDGKAMDAAGTLVGTTGTDDFGLQIFNGASILGQAGFTFYF